MLDAYQVRFIKEYDDLVSKYIKLNTIIKKAEDGILDFELKCPVELLKEQSEVMWRYIEILWERSMYEKVDLVPITNS